MRTVTRVSLAVALSAPLALCSSSNIEAAARSSDEWHGPPSGYNKPTPGHKFPPFYNAAQAEKAAAKLREAHAVHTEERRRRLGM